MSENRRRISLRDGKILIDGIPVADSTKLTFTYTPETHESKSLGENHYSTRWIGRKITGSISEYRANNYLRDYIKAYEETGRVPEMTITGIRDDKGSDFYDETGAYETVTLTGCVITGDINLLSLDVTGDVAQDDIAFNACNVIF